MPQPICDVRAELDELRTAWSVPSGPRSDRLSGIIDRMQDVLGSPATGPNPSELLADPDIDGWIDELESSPDAERRQLLLSAVVLFSERHGMTGRLALWAQGLVRQPEADSVRATELRAAAFTALARCAPPALITEWMKGLGSDNPDEKLGAIRLLANTRSELAARAMASVIVEGDVRVVQTAMWAAGEIAIADPILVAVLLDALRERFCAGDAAEALGRLAQPDAIRPLMQEAARGETATCLLAVARIAERHRPLQLADAELRVHRQTLAHTMTRHTDPAARILAALVSVRFGFPVRDADIDHVLMA